MSTGYVHTVQYYETDKMGITHHSNYVRWMEEARIAFLSDLGWEYSKLEAMGIVSPVLGISCEYKKPTTFSDQVTIFVTVREFKGVRLYLNYEMKNQDGEMVCLAQSSHAFFDTEGKPIRMKREYPELYQVLAESAEA